MGGEVSALRKTSASKKRIGDHIGIRVDDRNVLNLGGARLGIAYKFD